MRVMVVGSGGREHALLDRLRQSSEVTRLYALPGNAGTAELAENIQDDPTSPTAVVQAAQEHRVDLVVVGPEAPLAAGVVDALTAAGRPTFGPTRGAAGLEASKLLAKEVMAEAAVPTAAHYAVRSMKEVENLLGADRQWVVKADGLMAGKGVIVPQDDHELLAAAQELLAAQQPILLEERLTGPEVSLLALTDGWDSLLLPVARDHKRLGDGNVGPNTGGMGAYVGLADFDALAAQACANQVVAPILDAMRRRGQPFQGCLFAGLMLTKDGPKVLEYNVRFGDPETEAILPSLRGDLLPVLWGIAQGRLPRQATLQPMHPAAVTVVMAAPGYPQRPMQGLPIRGLELAEAVPGVRVYHAGTRRQGHELLSSGGRVLAVTAVGTCLDEARRQAYQAVSLIDLPGAQFRSDIGAAADLGG